jgi:hypothetical protein|tara:strand:+ start:431 stop:619 length:189 start_codon:yes stop_codon:yes gene_type:complete
MEMSIVILVFMICAAIVVTVGVIAMAVNGKFNKENSNKLMRLRILFQSIALTIVVLLVLLST